MADLLPKLLQHFNLTLEGYEKLIAEPSFSNIPLLNKDEEEVQKAKSIILSAIREHKKILVYGDYDCDGIMSTSIIAKTIKKLGGEAATYIPSRYTDGYGINLDNAKKISVANYNLVIVVDNGVTAFDGINELKKNNIQVVCIDHHELADELPNVDALLHPSTLNYGDYPISAGYLCFLFSIALLNGKDDYLLCLGALSTISDMMPLKGHNREIVRLALQILNKNRYPSFNLLCETQEIDMNGLSMSMIPAINAIGRMVEDSTINRLVPYFVEEDLKKIMSLSIWMKDINQKRKEMTKAAYDSISINKEEYGVVAISDLKIGLNGLLANQLIQKYNKPTIVFSKSPIEKGILVGSIRTKEGVSVTDCLNEFKSFLVSGGGHEKAGGLSIRESDFEDFKKAFCKYCFNHPCEKTKDGNIEIQLDDITKTNCLLIDSFGPFGTEWKQPKFVIKNVNTSSFKFVKDGKMLCYYLSNGSKILSFEISKDSVNNKSSVDLIGTIRQNKWNNSVNIEYLCNLLV